MSTKLTLAVIECDVPVDAVHRSRGTYGDIFQKLLARASERANAPGPRREIGVIKVQAVECQTWPPLDNVDAILISGSKHTAHEDHPWILTLLKKLQNLIATTSKPVVGICFGHQILARALGAKIGRSPGGWEVAVGRVELGPTGRQMFNKEYIDLHQMHRDAVLETPAGTENLGHSPSCGIQGFYRPCRFLTFQAHPEFDEEIMTEVVHARFRQGVFDQALYEDALSRVGNSHDGDLVSGLMLQFLVDCAQVNAG